MVYYGHIGNIQIDRDWLNPIVNTIYTRDHPNRRYVAREQREHRLMDIHMNAPRRYFHVYQCAPSSEARGRRPAHDRGCGYYNLFKSKIGMRNDQSVQASPCEECGKRQRLNSGLVFTFGLSRDAEIFQRVLNFQREMRNVSNNFDSERELLTSDDEIEANFNNILSEIQDSGVIS